MRRTILCGLVVFLATGLPLLAQYGHGPCGGAGQGMGPGMGQGRGMLQHMSHVLELTEEQQVQVREIFHRYHEDTLGDLAQAMHQARQELQQVVHDPTTDEQQVADAVAEVSTRSESLALEQHRMVLEIAEVLTEEQRTQLSLALEQRPQGRYGDRPRHRRGRPGR